MHPLLNFLALLLALPLVGWSIALLALEHAIRSTRPLELLLDFLIAYVWGVPILLVAILALAVAGAIRRARRVAAAILIGANLAALAIVFAVMGPPPGAAEAVVLLPTLVSVVLAAIVIRSPLATR